MRYTKSKRFFIAALLIAALICIITLTVIYRKSVFTAFCNINVVFNELSGNAQELITDKYLSVEIGDIVPDNEDSDINRLEITLKNKSNQCKSFIITIEAYNKNGDKISADSVSVENLEPNAEIKTYTFKFKNTDDADNFKITNINMF